MGRFEWKSHTDIFKGVGIYHVTFAVRDRKPLLGQLAIDHGEARCIPTDFGCAISHDLDGIGQRKPHVRLLAKQLMPDHIHVLLYITEDCADTIKEIARGMRQGWRHIAASVSIDPQMPSAATSFCPASVSIAPQMPSAATSLHPASVSINPQIPSAGALFEAPFIRTLVRKGQLQAMIAYIHDNPRRAMLRRQHPDLFTLRRNMQVRDLTFSALGNLFLLDYPDKQAIICSRSLTEQQISAQQTAALRHAENGCITLTAAISNGEKQIARAIREAGYPLVILLKDGFPKVGDEHERYYRPGGVYFEACAAGRLLLLEPTADTLTLPNIHTCTEQTLREKAETQHRDYQPIPITSDRYRMMAANEIIKQLCL